MPTIISTPRRISAPTLSLSRNQTGASAGGRSTFPACTNSGKDLHLRSLRALYSDDSRRRAPTPCPIPNSWPADFSEILCTTSEGVDNLGRTTYAGEIYDPRSAMQITNATRIRLTVKRSPAANNNGKCATHLLDRNPIPGNKLGQPRGFTPDKVRRQAAKLLPSRNRFRAHQ